LKRIVPLTVLLLFLGITIGMLLAPRVKAECQSIEVSWWSPTGIQGCEVYGAGIASHWPGPGVARNDCLWPWTSCIPVTVTSLETGQSIIVTPTMYCDCYTGTSDQRIADLDPAALKALGLWEMRAQGLFRVTVQPAISLPDTALPSSG
jgi:hypothetical protein